MSDVEWCVSHILTLEQELADREAKVDAQLKALDELYRSLSERLRMAGR